MMASLFSRRFRTLFMVRNSILWDGNLHTSKVYFADDSTAKTSLYEILKIPSSASSNEIKQAYYDLTLKYHPDRNENCEVAATKFREVAEAYEILGNYGLRKKYDRGIPLTIVKKTIKRTPVDHNVKYQKFFESRTAKSSSSMRTEEIDKLSSKREPEDNFEDGVDDIRHNRNAVQFIVATFICCVIIFSHTK